MSCHVISPGCRAGQTHRRAGGREGRHPERRRERQVRRSRRPSSYRSDVAFYERGAERDSSCRSGNIGAWLIPQPRAHEGASGPQASPFSSSSSPSRCCVVAIAPLRVVNYSATRSSFVIARALLLNLCCCHLAFFGSVCRFLRNALARPSPRRSGRARARTRTNAQRQTTAPTVSVLATAVTMRARASLTLAERVLSTMPAIHTAGKVGFDHAAC